MKYFGKLIVPFLGFSSKIVPNVKNEAIALTQE